MTFSEYDMQVDNSVHSGIDFICHCAVYATFETTCASNVATSVRIGLLFRVEDVVIHVENAIIDNTNIDEHTP